MPKQVVEWLFTTTIKITCFVANFIELPFFSLLTPSLINKSMNKYPQFGTNWHPISWPIFLHNYLIDMWIVCPKTGIEIHLWCREGVKFVYRNGWKGKKFGPFLDLCVSSLRRGHANLLCIVPILSDVSEETKEVVRFRDIKTGLLLLQSVWVVCGDLLSPLALLRQILLVSFSSGSVPHKISTRLRWRFRAPCQPDMHATK